MKRICVLSPIALFMGLLLAGASAKGYTLANPVRTWNCPPNVTVDVTGVASVGDSDGGVSNVVDVINSLTNSWNTAGSGRIISAHAGSAVYAEGDGVPVISFDDPGELCDEDCLARTAVTYFKRTGSTTSYQIYDADTMINLSYAWTSQEEDPLGSGCSGEFYIEAVLMHEMGHTLGLEHSSATGATMKSGSVSCNHSKASPETDDHNGILALYGEAPCTSALFNPCIDFTEYLTGAGDSDLQPCGGSFVMNGSATIRGWLEGPDGTDFDLYLEKWNGSAFVPVVGGVTASSSEAVTYNAAAGTYRFKVISYSGKGTYHFWYQRPIFFPPL